MKLLFFPLFIIFIGASYSQSHWAIVLSSKTPETRMSVWKIGDYSIFVELDTIDTFLIRNSKEHARSFYYYCDKDSNLANYFEASLKRYERALQQFKKADEGFDLRKLIIYEGIKNSNQNNGNSSILERYIKQLVEQGKAIVFYKGQLIFKLTCISELRDNGGVLTFSDFLNRGYEIRTCFDQRDNYLFYEYHNMGW